MDAYSYILGARPELLLSVTAGAISGPVAHKLYHPCRVEPSDAIAACGRTSVLLPIQSETMRPC